MIKEAIVVEGKEDTRRLKEVFGEIHTIETRGSAIDDQVLNYIKHARDTKGVIILTDPDHPGQRIRHIINQAVPGCKNAYIDRAHAIDERKRKIGVEHCSDEVILKAISDIATVDTQYPSSDVDYHDLMNLGLAGTKDSKALRDYMSEKLNIGYNNAKQFYRNIRHFNIQLEHLNELKAQYDREAKPNHVK